MKDPRDPMKSEDLGDGPETRMENLPKAMPQENDLPRRPRSADAVGNDDAQELVDMDESDVRSRGDNRPVAKKTKTIPPA